MNRIFIIFCIAAVSLIGSVKVHAESLIATWSMKDGPLMTIELQDQENFRMNMGADTYILVNQGKGYLVSREDGEWVAMSMESMKEIMKMSGIQDLMAKMGEQPIQENRAPQFEKTGRVETIAGITGQVYLVSMDNEMGQPETVEMVFGDDPRLMRLHQAQARWTESSEIISGPYESSFSEFMKTYAENGPDGAMLRYSDIIKLESVQEAKIAQSRFTIPRVKEMDFGSAQGMESQKHVENTQRQTEKQDEEEIETDLDGVIKGVDSLLNGLSGILGN